MANNPQINVFAGQSTRTTMFFAGRGAERGGFMSKYRTTISNIIIFSFCALVASCSSENRKYSSYTECLNAEINNKTAEPKIAVAYCQSVYEATAKEKEILDRLYPPESDAAANAAPAASAE